VEERENAARDRVVHGAPIQARAGKSATNHVWCLRKVRFNQTIAPVDPLGLLVYSAEDPRYPIKYPNNTCANLEALNDHQHRRRHELSAIIAEQ
jgi:hypothetical protein